MINESSENIKIHVDNTNEQMSGYFNVRYKNGVIYWGLEFQFAVGP